MSFSNDFENLADLHQRGLLSDEEFARAKARLLDGMPQSPRPQKAAGDLSAALNALRRSRDDRWLGGVCGGLAQISGLASWIWRLIFLGLLFCSGTGLIAYLLLWLVLPEESAAPRLGWNGHQEGGSKS